MTSILRPRSRTLGYARWRTKILIDCSPEWEDFGVYRDWLMTAGPGRFLRKKDESLPHGPTNTFMSRDGENSRLRLIGFLVNDGVSPADAEKRVRGISRQRLHILLAKYKGVQSAS